MQRISEMQIEKRALLDHAGRCRRTADEIEMEHARAAERLIAMAQEYEARAATFGNENESRKAPGWGRSVNGLAVAAFAALALLMFRRLRQTSWPRLSHSCVRQA